MSRLARILGLCALILAAGSAAAADFDRPDLPDPPARPGYGVRVDGFGGDDFRGYGPERGPPPAAEFRGPRFTAAPPEACREFVRRALDPDGEPVLRRVRVCDEPAFGRGPPPPPPEEVPPRRWGGPRW